MIRRCALVASLALVGCGEPAPPPCCIDPRPDGGPVPAGCNALAAPGNQGCQPGEKCAWSNRADGTGGQFECGFDGFVSIGGDCTVGASFRPGFLWDDCVAGTMCTSGLCIDLCGSNGTTTDTCADGRACFAFEGQFGPGAPPAGVCDEECDPLTQLRRDGTACPFGGACYLIGGDGGSISVCAPPGWAMPGVMVADDARPNTCVPGAQPRRRDSTTGRMECGGLCRPADVTATTNLADEGGVGADSCNARWGAALPDDTTAGESCRYWWARERHGRSSYGNDVGWCFEHAGHAYDTDGRGIPDTPYPRCRDVTTGDVLPPFGSPPHNDALYFWCIAAP